MSALLSTLLGPVIGVVIAVGSGLWLWIARKGDSAKVATATAAQSNAELATAQVQAAVAEQNSAADQRATEVVQSKEAAQQAAQATPDANVDAELDKLGGLRK